MHLRSKVVPTFLLIALIMTVVLASSSVPRYLRPLPGEVEVEQGEVGGPWTDREEGPVDGPVPGGEPGGVDGAEPASFSLETIWVGDGISFGFDATTTLVIQSEEEWLALWSRASVLALAPPAVDFATQTVLVAMLGPVRTMGYSIQIEDVSAAGEGMYLALVEINVSGKGCTNGAAIAYPVHMVSIAKAEGSFHFEDEAVIVNCG